MGFCGVGPLKQTLGKVRVNTGTNEEAVMASMINQTMLSLL